VRQHAPDFDPSTVELRLSKEGTYLSVTATVNAVSRAQLDELYRALTSHPLVKVVL
jgi:putative lipoic acid-binding regulatory protein